MALISSFFPVFVCILVAVIVCVECSRKLPHASLFVFGDSILDPGNNNYINTTTDFQSNWWPYGESFFKYPTGRPCDGRLISDFIDLKTQLKYFKKVTKLLKKKVGGKHSKKLISNSVYMFSAGTVDYGEVFRSSSLHLYPKQQLVEMVLANLTSVLKEIYKKGGRKFVIFSLIPLGCFPGARAFTLQQNKSGDCINELNELLKIHSLALPKRMEQLQEELTGFKYTLFDLYKVIDQRINHPSKFGFEVSKMACCGTGPFRGINSCGGKRQVKDYQLCKNPKDYVFFDATHPSESTYKQCANLLWHGDPDVTGPHSLKSFFEVPG
ncbi:unnamed protein product [Withania somnifera]